MKTINRTKIFRTVLFSGDIKQFCFGFVRLLNKTSDCNHELLTQDSATIQTR